MYNDLNNYRKAHNLDEVDSAVRFTVPITADHEFFTDFSAVRGDFEDRMIYRTINVHPKTFVFNYNANRGNKTILFLAGMRGSGKTSELAKISKNLHNPEAFFCVTCNLDIGLDINDMEYMDILIFQLERLFEELNKVQLKVDDSVIGSLQDWFSERLKEINKSIRREGGFEVNVEAKSPGLLSFLGITAKIKASLQGSKENAYKIRTVFKQNFTDFSRKFNEFVEHINLLLRNKKMAKELLFIIDGLEKVATADIRKKIIKDESNRIKQIKVNTIFTLPLELMSLRPQLMSYSTVVSFPFVKIREKDDTIIEKAVDKFVEFVYKRINKSLFTSISTVKKAIYFSGGSPRELLRILEYANWYADEDKGIIDDEAMETALDKLAAESSHYVSREDLDKLKVLKENNANGIPTPFDLDWQELLENLVVMEYNDGTYKRVHPLIEKSNLYQQYVG